MKQVITILLLAVLLASCQHKTQPTVQELISRYALTSKNHWENEERTLQFYTYTNYKTDSLLHIIINKKGDTLLKYIGRCNNCDPFFFKVDKTWLVLVGPKTS